jgi:hypothetical protein
MPCSGGNDSCGAGHARGGQKIHGMSVYLTLTVAVNLKLLFFKKKKKWKGEGVDTRIPW